MFCSLGPKSPKKAPKSRAKKQHKHKPNTPKKDDDKIQKRVSGTVASKLFGGDLIAPEIPLRDDEEDNENEPNAAGLLSASIGVFGIVLLTGYFTQRRRTQCGSEMAKSDELELDKSYEATTTRTEVSSTIGYCPTIYEASVASSYSESETERGEANDDNSMMANDSWAGVPRGHEFVGSATGKRELYSGLEDVDLGASPKNHKSLNNWGRGGNDDDEEEDEGYCEEEEEEEEEDQSEDNTAGYSRRSRDYMDLEREAMSREESYTKPGAFSRLRNRDMESIGPSEASESQWSYFSDENIHHEGGVESVAPMRRNAVTPDIQTYLNQRYGLSDDLSGLQEHLAEIYGPPDDFNSYNQDDADDDESNYSGARGPPGRSYLEL